MSAAVAAAAVVAVGRRFGCMLLQIQARNTDPFQNPPGLPAQRNLSILLLRMQVCRSRLAQPISARIQ